jgi:serine/threonine protein kinase
MINSCAYLLFLACEENMHSPIDFSIFNNKKPLPSYIFELLSDLESKGKTSLEANTPYKLKSGKMITLKQDIISINKKEWHVIENTRIGKGTFGEVKKCLLKIVSTQDEARLNFINEVAKIIRLPQAEEDRNEAIEAAVKEATWQKEHQVDVKGIFVGNDRLIIFTENCGISLDQAKTSKDFDEALSIAVGIINEVLLLQKHSMVHRDLKPENFCRDSNKDNRITLIDFGYAFRKSDEITLNDRGTAFYMPPDEEVTSAFDRFPLGPILAKVFNCPHFSPEKMKALGQYNARKIDHRTFIKIPYDFTYIFTNYKGLDPQLVKDTKRLLNELTDPDPKKRPPIEFVMKFFLKIRERRRAYAEFLKQLEELENNSTSITTSFMSLFNSEDSIKQKEKLLQWHKIKEQGGASHYELISKMYYDCTVKFENPFPDLRQESNQEFLKLSTPSRRDTLLLTLHNNMLRSKFNNSNSAGYVEIIKILQSTTDTPDQKISQLKRLGVQKTEDTFWNNSYCRSGMFFGPGRHKNMHEIYKKMAVFTKNDIVQRLSELNNFIEKETEFAPTPGCFG